MAPITRSQFIGELIKYTLDIPTIMEYVVRNLIQTQYVQYSIPEAYMDLSNLKLVFKSKRTQDTINNYFIHIRLEYKMYLKQCAIERQISAFFFRENNQSNMDELYEYTEANISTVKYSPSLGNSIISKFLVFVTLSKTPEEFDTRMNKLRNLRSLIV